MSERPPGLAGVEPEAHHGELWRTIVEQSPFSVVVYDAQGRLLAVNAAFGRLWGVGVETVPPGYSVLHDPQLEAHGLLPQVRRAFAGETVATPPVRYDTSSLSATGTGRTTWTQGYFYPVHDAAGRLVYVVLTHVDLSERVAAEEALRASERRFAGIVRQATVGIAQADPEGRFLVVNDRFCELVGRPAAELLALRVADVTHPDDVAHNGRLFERAVATGEPFTVEKRYRRPDGGVVWVNNSVTVTRDGDGRVENLLAASVDVTSRRRAEERLRLLAGAGAALSGSLDVGEMLRSVAALPVPSFAAWSLALLVDESGALVPTVTECAAPAKRERVDALVRRIVAMPGRERSVLRRAADTGEPQLVREITPEFMAATSDDPGYHRLVRELAPVSMLAVPIVVRGRSVGVLAYVSDDPGLRFDDADLAFAAELARRAATALENARLYEAERAARARTERLQQITSALAAVLPGDEVGTLFAGEVRQAFGADTAWLGLLSDDRSEFVALAHSGFAEAGIAPWLRFPADAPVPAGHVAADGVPLWFRSAAEFRRAYPAVAATLDRIEQEAVAFLPLRVGAATIGVMTLGFRRPHPFSDAERDFALALAHQCAQALERARLYDAERAARAEAEAANRAKSDFLAKMSHELRTPLNAIGGYAELIQLGVHGAVTAEQHVGLERIQVNQRHLLGLITDILDFSKVEAGVVRLRIEAVEVGPVLLALEPLIGPQMRSRGVVFEVEPCPGPAAVRGDRDRIVQICLNLLSNALKATPAGGRVSFGCVHAGGRLAFRVRDTGVGIPADRREAIFAPFAQLGRTLNRPGEGVGLGLTISRELARAMGGEILVESEEGAGSVFELVLPRA